MQRRLPDNRRPCEVLLIHPPWFKLQESTLLSYPAGPAAIAAVLEREGIDALIWNADFNPDKPLSIGGTNILKTDDLTRSHEQYLRRLDDLSDPVWEETLAIVELTKPKAIGFSCYSSTFRSVANLATLIRKRYPEMPLVIGGVHPSIAPERCLEECPALDVAVFGEGDVTAPPLFRALMQSGRRTSELQRLSGIVYRQDGTLRKNAPPAPVTDLDALPLPARHRLIDLDTMPPATHQALYGFRGCPFQCIFCGSFNVFGRKPRMRSARSMAEEIRTVHQTFGTHYFYICDDIFLMEKQRVLEFTELLHQWKLPISYSIQSRGEMIDPTLLKRLKKTGCQHIAVGVEVGNEEIRKKIKKGNTVADMRRAGLQIREAGLRMSGFFMFGFPWETREHLEETARLMEELDPTVAFPYIVTPAIGTELHSIALQMNLISDHADFASFSHVSPKMGLTMEIPEAERKELIDRILDRFAEHNRRSLRGDIFKRPLFYYYAAKDAGILSSVSSFVRHLGLLLK